MRIARGWGVEGVEVGVGGRKWRVAVWRGGEGVVVVVSMARVVGRRERRRVGRRSMVGGLEGGGVWREGGGFAWECHQRGVRICWFVCMVDRWSG